MPDSPRNGASDSPASRPVDAGDNTNSVTAEKTAVQTGGGEQGIMRAGSGNEVSPLDSLRDQRNLWKIVAHLEAKRSAVPSEFGGTPEITSGDQANNKVIPYGDGKPYVRHENEPKPRRRSIDDRPLRESGPWGDLSFKAEDTFPRLIKDPAQQEAFFQALSNENNLDNGKNGPFVFQKADAKPGEKGYIENELRVVTAEDVKNGTNIVPSSENEVQILKEGDYKVWKLTNGQRDGQLWGLRAEKLTGENARYKFERDEGNGRLIYSSKAVPTPMAPLSQPRGLELHWGTQTGGPGALMAKYGEGDHNIITNYDLARMYEKGANPESQAEFERIQKMVETSFSNLKAEGGKQVPQQDGKQRWQFPYEPNANNARDWDDLSRARNNLDRTVTDAATKLGIKLTVVVGDVAKTVTPGMTPDEFRTGLEDGKRLHNEMKRTSTVEPSKIEGRTVYNFGSEADRRAVSELAAKAAYDSGENIRIKIQGVETEIKPGTKPSEAHGLIMLSSATERATKEYFSEQEVPDAEKRARLQSLNLRSEMFVNLPQAIEAEGHAKLFKLFREVDPAGYEVLVRTQDGVNEKIVPLSPEEVRDLGRARVERASKISQMYHEFSQPRTEAVLAELGQPRQTAALQPGKDLVVTKANGETEVLKPGTLEKAVEAAHKMTNDPDPEKQHRGKQFIADLEQAHKGNNAAGLRVLGTWGTLIGLVAFLPAGATMLESQRRDFKPASVGSR